jgi:serralysin
VSKSATARSAIDTFSKTGINLIDGVMSGYGWSANSITYAFPDSQNDYNYGPEKNHHFQSVSIAIEHAAEFILDTSYGSAANDGFSVEGFTNLDISQGANSSSEIRYGMETDNQNNPTAYAYYPSTSSRGGDVWFGTNYNYSHPVAGNYAFATVIHETGHTLGLKHGHQASSSDLIKTTLANKYDSLEYSVMTYHSFVGDDGTGYKNEKFGFPQTYMMADIAALQHMYGANYSVNSTSTVYSWKPGSGDTFVNGAAAIEPGANRIFATIWDGGGTHDTYDLSAYHSNLQIDLRPGQYSVFSHTQLADLDASSSSSARIARGNIFNALLHNHNTASLIEDAVGGSGNDIINGNQGKNDLSGQSGNDHLDGFGGNDILTGGGGKDVFIFGHGDKNDTIADFSNDRDRVDLTEMNINNYSDLLGHAHDDGSDVVLKFGHHDTLTIDNIHVNDLSKHDFVL